MVNEEKIILMTKLASYEQGEGKKYISIGSYFRSDYISTQVLKSVISGTIAFMVLFGVAIFYNFEAFMQGIYKIDMIEIGKRMGIIYVIFVGIYALLSYILATYRYNRAKQSLKTYYGNLKKLSKYYD